MAKSSAVDQALAHIDAEIAAWQRAREMIVASIAPTEAAGEKKPRKPRVKRGLPTAAHEQ